MSREKEKMGSRSSGSNSSSSQVIRCKGVVCWGAEEEWRVEEIQVDPPKGSEVRMKMLFASVCHSDLLCSRGFPFPLYPRVLGHEGVGIVESVGEEVKEFKEGDVVIPAYIGECRECENCNSEKTNLCLRYPLSFNGLLPDGTSRMSIQGQTLYHLVSCSTWSEYTVSDANYVVKVDPDVALRHASFLSCGFSTGFGAAWMDSKIESGSSVAVIGLGAVGLGAIGGARARGAATIIGVDKTGMKKDKGEAFGMTHFLNPYDLEPCDGVDSKSISKMVKDLTGGAGVDYCFECTGVPDLINQALEATKMGKGRAVVVGAGLDPVVQINFLELLMGRTLKGTIFGGLKSKTHLPILFHKSKTKEIQLDELLTDEMRLEDVPRAQEVLKRSDCVKILIKI